MEIVEQLLELGFSEYEANVYTALITGNKLSASEVCKLAGVPKGRAYSILSSLMDMGMCSMIPGTVKKYQALPPKEAFHTLYEERRLAYEAETLKAMRLSSKLAEIYDSEEDIDTESDIVSIYTSPITITKKSEQMVENTQKIHRSFCKPPYLAIQSHKEVDTKSGSILDAMNRGVEFRSIYEYEEHDFDNFIYICNYFHERGEKVKIMKKLPIKLAIMDSSVALFTMHHRALKKNKFASMFIENSDIIVALTDLFDYYWEDAMSYIDFINNGYKID